MTLYDTIKINGYAIIPRSAEDLQLDCIRVYAKECIQRYGVQYLEGRFVSSPHLLDPGFEILQEPFHSILLKSGLADYWLSPCNDVQSGMRFPVHQDDRWGDLSIIIYALLYLNSHSDNSPAFATIKLGEPGTTQLKEITLNYGDILLLNPETPHESTVIELGISKLLIKQMLIISSTQAIDAAYSKLKHDVLRSQHTLQKKSDLLKITIAKSSLDIKGGGLGVFSLEPIRKGNTIFEKNIQSTSFPITRLQAFSHPFGNHSELMTDGLYKVNYCIDSFINHNCSPNSYVNVSCGGLLKVIASDDISKNTEITIDYSLTSVSEYGKKNAWMFDCKCGSGNCRKVISGDITSESNSLIQKALLQSGGWVKRRLRMELNE